MERFHWSEKEVGYSLGFVGILVAIVQGGLIRYINPWLGAKRSVYWGLVLYCIGLSCFAFANQSWMMYAALIPYCLSGICGPALQGIMSAQVPGSEQGELQGALTSLISLTSIVGPVMMTNVFARFTASDAPFYFPGAAFLLGAVFCFLSLLFALRTLAKHTALIAAGDKH